VSILSTFRVLLLCRRPQNHILLVNYTQQDAFHKATPRYTKTIYFPRTSPATQAAQRNRSLATQEVQQCHSVQCRMLLLTEQVNITLPQDTAYCPQSESNNTTCHQDSLSFTQQVQQHHMHKEIGCYSHVISSLPT
jgi:hypothetical protein